VSAFILAFIIIAEIWGKQGRAEFLFISLLRSTASLLGFILLMHMIRGFIERIVFSPSLQRMVLFSGNTDAIIRRTTRFINITLSGLIILPAILAIWGVYSDLSTAVKGLLALGFTIGSQRVSVGLVMVSAGILYASFLASWIVQRLLTDGGLAKHRLEKGVRVSIASLARYALIFIGFLMAIFVLGFDFTNLTIMLSALGVGIGFGLQSVATNFISGLVLLFERPVRVDDFIELEGKWAKIKDIGLRATIVQTFDQADVIIPNADLVGNRVINWTLSNRSVRLIIPVGVAYGSDISLAMETLIMCASKNSRVAKIPEPQVLFLNFGEGSLDLELRVWVLDAAERLTVKSELHQEIDRQFREAEIEISFPQRDLHLRSVDESITFQHAEGQNNASQAP